MRDWRLRTAADRLPAIKGNIGLTRVFVRPPSSLRSRRAAVGPRAAAALLAVLALGLTAPGRVAAAEVRLRAPPEISRLLSPFLPETTASHGRLRELLGEILATEGYFSPQFDFSRGEDPLEVGIEPGPRTRVVAVDIAVDGALADDEIAALRASWQLPAGQPFRQADWDTAKEQLLTLLLSVERAGARLVDSEAAIDPLTNSASLRVKYDAGPRYRFGELKIVGLERYDADLVTRYNKTVKPGAPYNEAELSALRSALQATPWFGSVEVGAETREGGEVVENSDGTLTVPVVIRVRERPRQRLSFGVGVSSNTGARAEVGNAAIGVFGRPWQLNSGLRVEQKRQTVYADLFLPPDTNDRLNSAGVLVEKSDIQSLTTERYAIGLQSVTVRGKLEQKLGLNWQSERSTPSGAEAATNRALYPNVTWTWRDVDDLFNPRRGFVAQAHIGAARKALLSDQDFVRVHGRTQHYFPFGQKDTLTLRAELGTTFASTREGIPQDYLFRAGGAGSVRGYAYQSLGLREGDATVGGRYLYVVSGEYTHWLSESWGAAVFIDAGDAVDSLKDARPAFGYGAGVRWRSPAGPIGVDFAYGERDRSFQVHFSLAIPF